ncbi:superinfection immunity protein [Bradyrhizobium sp. Cp5.3]|uniref:superinfection immunity protein n=1 Tax=Bradyrhizobium sp. Cp5.3 TaxID=443598 RepID=UPI0018DDC35E|nr:superinfection immunity protein [Bradyrhizobium sp. Cp5.3]
MRLLTWTAALAVTLVAHPALAATPSDGADAVAGLMAIGILIAAYFFPAIIALLRGHHNTLAIFLLNLFFGWTFFGWLGALIWAATVVQRPTEYRMVHDERARCSKF